MELTLNTPLAEGLDRGILDKLFGVLKSWADDMDAFRYEMFARRLIAAEYGRPDAVVWATDWYESITQEEAEAAATRQKALAEIAAQSAREQAAFLEGRCGNPHYQAYLDTVENPATISHHAEYLIWMSTLVGEYQGTPGWKDLPHSARTALWRNLLTAKRDANLAPRLKGHPTRLPFEKA